MSKLIGTLLLLAAGTGLGLGIAWLKISYGFSPYWFVAAATAFGLVASFAMTLLLLGVRRTVFVLDWVVSFESLVFTSVLSVLGVFILAMRFTSGKVALVIAVGLFAVTTSVVVHVFRNAPSLTWGDAEQIVGREPRERVS